MNTVRTSRCLRVVSASVCLLASCVSAGAADALPPAVEELLSIRAVHSPSGRFTAYATNTVQASDLARWADGIAARMDRALGDSPPAGRQAVRLVLREDRASTSGWARVTMPPPNLQIVVANYATVDVTTVARALVAGLLADFRSWGSSQRVDAATAPGWLVTGMMSTIEPDSREADYGTVFKSWREGALPPLTECLSNLATPAASDATAGVIVQWILSMKGREACVRDVMARSAGGAAPRPDWFFASAGCSTPADLETAWEKWLSGRQWVIGSAGRRPEWIVERIREERLIYPADSGIPNSKPGDAPLTAEDLIKERKEPWAAKAAASRAVRLRLMAAGRGSEVGSVIEAYSLFYEAVRDGQNEAALKSLLADADRKLDALASGAMGKTPAQGSGADTRQRREIGSGR